MDESNDKGFATGEANFSGFAIVGESYPDLPNYPHVQTSRTNNASGSTEIQIGYPFNPYLSVCSGGGFPLTIMSNPASITYSVPSSLYGYWQIVRVVAEKDSTYEYAGVYHCPFCEASQKRESSLLPDEELSKLFPHDADCIVFLARAMVATMPHVEGKE